eukprot:5559706-Alexandrium_andersonii.AAC.1
MLYVYTCVRFGSRATCPRFPLGNQSLDMGKRGRVVDVESGGYKQALAAHQQASQPGASSSSPASSTSSLAKLLLDEWAWGWHVPCPDPEDIGSSSPRWGDAL